MRQSDRFEVTIPALPPGANRTYRPIKRAGKPGLILTKEARAWDSAAALVVGAAASQLEFEPAPDAEYEIVIRWWGGRHDADAHLKLVQDCVTRKLGFDDRQIKTCVIQRWVQSGPEEGEGVQVHLFTKVKRDWLTQLIAERLGLDLRRCYEDKER
jgi:Holliday junction resolvase RusA-like endonuclease